MICGGSGKRLWPLSRENFPKPYIKFNQKESLFQETVRRHSNAESLTIVTNEALYYQSMYQCNQLHDHPPTDVILESVGRDTGPAILLAALHCKPNDLMVVTPADHHISPLKNYQSDIQSALEMVKKTNGIVLIGIDPTHASTEYGYIKANKTTVESFKEKPDKETAKAYIKTNQYYWNSGIFCFESTTIIEEFKRHAPTIFEQVLSAYKLKSDQNIVDLATVEPIQFDRGILEKSNHCHVIKNSFNWSDIGCFDELEKFIPKKAPSIAVNATNNFAMSSTDKTIAFHDVDDLYLIESNDAILVGKKEHSNHVSEVVKSVKDVNPTLLKHSNIVYRPWGYYNVLFESKTYKVKQIVVYPNQRLSLQKHEHRSEHWTCVLGTITVVNGDQRKTLHPNESIYIEKKAMHRMENHSTSNAEIIEVQCGTYLGEDDIIRLESDY